MVNAEGLLMKPIKPADRDDVLFAFAITILLIMTVWAFCVIWHFKDADRITALEQQIEAINE